MADVSVTRNDEVGRYEAYVDGVLAGFIDLRDAGGAVAMVHAEVDDAFGGQGVGSQMARQALDDVRSRGLRVVPACPFVAAFIDKHPDYADLVR